MDEAYLHRFHGSCNRFMVVLGFAIQDYACHINLLLDNDPLWGAEKPALAVVRYGSPPLGLGGAWLQSCRGLLTPTIPPPAEGGLSS